MPRRKCGNSKTKKTAANQQAQGAGKNKTCAFSVPRSPRAVRHNLSHRKTDLGLVMVFVRNKIGCDVLFTKPVAIYFSLVNVPRTKGKGVHRFVVTNQAPFPSPRFQRRALTPRFTRLPDGVRPANLLKTLWNT
jgi:hypothetical protein